VGIGSFFGIRDDLGDAVAIAQVEEREMAVVAAPMDPAGERDALTDLLGAQLAAGVAAEGGAHGRPNGSRSFVASSARMATRTRADRLRALREALRRAQSIGPISIPLAAGLGAGFVASFAIDALLFEVVATPWRQVIDAVAFVVVAAPAWLTVQRTDVRHAVEVLTWLNGWETERWQAEIGRRLPAVPRAHPELLDVLPDTMGLRPLRIELLGIRGEDDEAWRRLEALPVDTGWQRFEHAALAEWLLWLTDGPERIGEMEAAIADIDDDRRLPARAMVAAATARRAAVAGGDVAGPLAALRPELGDRPGRYAFSYSTGVIVFVALIGIVASVAVAVAATIIR
jgi:hypothetical protein